MISYCTKPYDDDRVRCLMKTVKAYGGHNSFSDKGDLFFCSPDAVNLRIWVDIMQVALPRCGFAVAFRKYLTDLFYTDDISTLKMKPGRNNTRAFVRLYGPDPILKKVRNSLSSRPFSDIYDVDACFWQDGSVRIEWNIQIGV